MKNLLIPFDGSESAGRALEHAIALARMTTATVHVIHVYEEPAAYALGEVAVYFPRDELMSYLREASEALRDAAAARLRAAGVPCVAESRVGPVAESIVDYAKTQHCDAIIMGTHGRSALGGLLMGSVATRVVHLTPVPVTLVK